jgi:hypothetical protein
MTTTEMVRQIAERRGLAVGLVYDPDAEASECWVASVGLDAFGAGGYPSAAIGAALLDLDRDLSPSGETPTAAVRWEVSA